MHVVEREPEAASSRGDVERLEEDAEPRGEEAPLRILDREQAVSRCPELCLAAGEQPHLPRLGVVRRGRPEGIVHDPAPDAGRRGGSSRCPHRPEKVDRAITKL
jgi:hypothetical protein